MRLGTNADDLDWLDQNSKASGVIVLPSGLQYKVLKAAAAGAKSPKIGTRCEVRYKVSLVSSGAELYDSKTKKNTSGLEGHTPNRIIRGWTLALQLMGVGDKWRLWVPSELAYGDAGSTKNCWMGVPAGAALSFDLELCAVRHDAGKPESKPGGIASVRRPASITHDEFMRLHAEAGGQTQGAGGGAGDDVPYMGGHFEKATFYVRTRAVMALLDDAAPGSEGEVLRSKILATWAQARELLERLDGAENFRSKNAKTLLKMQREEQRLQRENQIMRHRLA